MNSIDWYSDTFILLKEVYLKTKIKSNHSQMFFHKKVFTSSSILTGFLLDFLLDFLFFPLCRSRVLGDRALDIRYQCLLLLDRHLHVLPVDRKVFESCLRVLEWNRLADFLFLLVLFWL